MSNAPKTGFWQTIPGLITATAGFLSAATGAMVALNQTGVVDLKKMTGANPPAQSVPVDSKPAMSDSDEKSGTEKATSAAVEAAPEPAEKNEKPPDPKTADSRPSPDLSKSRVAEAKSPESGPAPSPSPATSTARVGSPAPAASNPGGSATPPPETAARPSATPETVAKPVPVTDGPAKVVEQKKEEPLRPIAEAPRKEDTATPVSPKAAERVAEGKPQVERAPTSPVQPPKQSPAPAEPRPAEARKQGPTPPPPPVQDRPSPPRPDPRERLADAKQPERAPEAPDARNADPAARPRVVRPGADEEPAGRGGKRLISEQDPDKRKSAGHEGAIAGSAAQELDLTGLKLSIPAGWIKESVAPGPMAPVAVLRIPDPTGRDGKVEISRYIGVKGKEMEDRTMDRWIGQVARANGSPMGRGDAKIERRQVGSVRVTTMELSGTVKLSAREAALPDSHMVAAIVDHPAGPHLITIVGPARSMAKWSQAIDEFLKSAKAQ